MIMEQYIPKSDLLAEINRLIAELVEKGEGTMFEQGRISAFEDAKLFLDTIEVKEANTWHLQEKEDIYDAVKDWSFYKFVCIMKDGTIQEFIGTLDEDYEGHINVHIDGVNDDYDNVDDIIKWIEYN
jgi:hypothetical protein